MKICSILTKAEMEADVVQVLEGLAEKGHEVHTILHTSQTSWNPDINGLRIYTTNDIFLLDRISPVNPVSLKAARIIKNNKVTCISS